MRTIKCNDRTVFHVNGDFSGDVIIQQTGTGKDLEMRVPMDTLDTLFAERLRCQKISQIESMSDQGIIQEAIDRL